MARALVRAAIVLAALGAAAGVGWHFYGGRWKRAYDAKVAALRAAAAPTRLEDLATPMVPDEENGARLLEQAHRMLEARQRERDGLLYDIDRTAEEEAALAAHLDSLAPYFEMLRRVAEAPGWRLDLDWKAGIGMRVDLYSQLFEAHRHIIARAQIDPKGDGRTERSAEAAVLMLALSGKCRGPFLVGHLVPMSLASNVEEILRAAMRRPGFDPAVFRRIVDPALARSIPERVPPRDVLVQERAFMIVAVKAFASGSPHHWSGRPVSFLRLPDLYREAVQMLDVLEAVIARSDVTPEEALVVAREMRPTLRADDLILGDVARVYARTFRVFADHVADLRLARIAMALLEYRQREDRWPESLAAIGETPTDPYSGGPFLYERTQGGCRVHAANDSAEGDLEEDRLGWTLRDDELPMTR